MSKADTLNWRKRKQNRSIEKKITQRSLPEKINTKRQTLTRQWDAHKIRDD